MQGISATGCYSGAISRHTIGSKIRKMLRDAFACLINTPLRFTQVADPLLSF